MPPSRHPDLWCADHKHHFEAVQPVVGFPGTLRDYFAGQALAGYLSKIQNTPGLQHLPTFDGTAIDCYKYADAMLKKRGKNHE